MEGGLHCVRLLPRAVALTQPFEPFQALGHMRKLVLIDALKHLHVESS